MEGSKCLPVSYAFAATTQVSDYLLQNILKPINFHGLEATYIDQY